MLDLSDEPVSMFADPEFVPYESVGSEKYRASRSILAFDGQVGHPVSGVVLSYKDTRLGDNFLAVRTGSKGSSDGAEDAASILAGAVLHMDYYPLGDQYAADECIDLENLFTLQLMMRVGGILSPAGWKTFYPTGLLPSLTGKIILCACCR